MNYLKLVLYLCIIAIFVTSAYSQSKNDRRPNIIFIMGDDHAAHAISSYGSRINKTPNIDRLAKQGVRFTNSFAANSLCAPSRAILISGKHSNANGLRRIGDKFDNTQITFPKLLQKAGYETALFGKWHLVTEPTGFDYYSVLPGQGSYYDFKLKNSNAPWKDGNKGGVSQKGYFTEAITNRSIKWLKNRTKDSPFLMMLHYKAPHTPHIYPKKYKKLYTDDIKIPGTFNDDYTSKNYSLLKGRGGYSKLDSIIPAHILQKPPAEISPEEHKYWAYQAFFKGYLRLVAALDDNVGRLLDFINASGLSENTVVVYTSDNGFFLGDHGLFNKMWMYEESMRLPLLIRYPKEIKPGTVNNSMVSILDIAPTLLDYAKAPIPQELHGRSIRPLLNGEKISPWRNSVYYHYYDQFEVPSHNGIRTKNKKLIHFYNAQKGPKWEFYDLETDPQELINLYNYPDKNIQKKIEKLKYKYNNLMKKFDGNKR